LYADTAIECAVVVESVYHLSLRATQRFLESVVRLMDIEVPVPDDTTVCTRQRSLDFKIRTTPGTQPRHLVIDSTGLKIFAPASGTSENMARAIAVAPHDAATRFRALPARGSVIGGLRVLEKLDCALGRLERGQGLDGRTGEPAYQDTGRRK